jgi:hypothetical protein
MNELILDFLKTNGERWETEIAKALDMPIALVQSQVSQLSSAGEVIRCTVTRYVGGKKVEGTSCRLSCYTPPRAPGPKPGAKRTPGTESNIQ